MSEETSKLSPPYVGFNSLLKFVRSQKGRMPDRIDRSVFGGMSGGLAYGILSALKFLQLINGDGVPSPQLVKLSEASEDEAKPILSSMLQSSYKGIFNGDVKLARATSGQFDDYLRSTFGVTGSTVDKCAVFFLAAAAEAGIEVSAQLKSRKPAQIGTRKLKLRRPPEPLVDSGVVRVAEAEPPKLRSPVEVLVSILDMSAMTEDEQQAVWTLIRFLKKQEAEKVMAE